MEELLEAAKAVNEIAPEVVFRHRSAGVLTWALAHKLEREVLDELTARGDYSDSTISMLRTSKALGYPEDDRPASFAGHGITPIVLGAIEKLWNRLH